MHAQAETAPLGLPGRVDEPVLSVHVQQPGVEGRPVRAAQLVAAQMIGVTLPAVVLPQVTDPLLRSLDERGEVAPKVSGPSAAASATRPTSLSHVSPGPAEPTSAAPRSCPHVARAHSFRVGPVVIGVSHWTLSSRNAVTSSAVELSRSRPDWALSQTLPPPTGGSTRWISTAPGLSTAVSLTRRSSRPAPRGPHPDQGEHPHAATSSGGRTLTNTGRDSTTNPSFS